MDTTPVIIEVALNGLTSPQTNPLVPITPGELAADAIECVDAGAVIVHTHADNMGAPPADLAERYAQCYRAVLEKRPDTILYPTVGLGQRDIDFRDDRGGVLNRLAMEKAGQMGINLKQPKAD